MVDGKQILETKTVGKKVDVHLNPEKAELLEVPVTTKFDEAISKYPHLRKYIEKISKELGMPEWYVELNREMRDIEYPNIIYPVGDPIFIHVYKIPGESLRYIAIEPKLTPKEEKLYDKIVDRLVELAAYEEAPQTKEAFAKLLIKLYNSIVSIKGREKSSFLSFFKRKIPLTKQEYEKIKYFLLRERIGYGKLEPLLRDPYLEDIHILGVGPVWVVHKIWGTMKTNIEFGNEKELNKYIIKTSELVERPVSDARPIVDAIMPDGSRVNFIYGKDISLKGSSFTIRKFTKKPISITQLIKWNTMSAEEAAYLWLAVEHGMNIFVSGETASGKTTTLNALTVFIRPDWKVYSVEDTPEVNIPHPVWQRLVTRQAGKTTDVEMYDLLRAALRSRPNYIIVGEIRGREGFVAFQAMQTGHPVMSTFHSGSLQMLIQRLTGNPINIPITFIDNLNIVVLQATVYIKGKMERRVVSIYEIERYIAELGKVAARETFVWDKLHDRHIFRGRYNSYILEKKIAPMLRLDDPRKIYDILDFRKRILERMVEEEIFDYFEVWEVIKRFYEYGPEGLPFTVY